MKIIKLFKAEFNKYLMEIRNYYPDHIGNVITTYIFFIGFFYALNPKSDAMDLTKSLIGFIMWFFSINVINEASATISEEKQIGTLEQIILRPTGLINIMMMRSFCWTILSFLQVAFLLLIIYMTTDLSFLFQWEYLPIFVITLCGLYGFGLILAGLTTLFTKTASFGGIIQYILLFFTGAFVKIDSLPQSIQVISKSLPLTCGIELAGHVASGEAGGMDLFFTSKFIFLVVNSTFYFLLGLMFFKIVFKYAMKKGILKQY